MAWSALLQDSLRDDALETARAILQEVAGRPRLRLPPGLLEGHAGFALCFELAARALDGEYLEQVGPCLQRATESLGVLGDPPVPGLHAGLSGIGWAAAHLAARHPDLDAEELCSAVDGLLEESLQQRPWPHPCDIRDGLAGIGLYALERVPHPSGYRLLERIVLLLEETAEGSEQGLTWRMPPRYWGLYGREAAFPRGLYTLGLAHGVPGALAVLAAAHALGVERERAGAMLEQAFRWVAHQAAAEGHPRFPHYLHGTERFEDARFSWCVGNPGITSVLWWAAHLWGHPDWEARTLRWAEAVAGEALQRTPLGSSNLCCGTAGTAHLFLRLFHATGRPVFADAASLWVRHTLSLRQPGVGIGGFCFEQDPARLRADLQFGVAGTALLLLAAATPVEPDWDQAFLFSLSLPTGAPERKGRGT